MTPENLSSPAFSFSVCKQNRSSSEVHPKEVSTYPDRLDFFVVMIELVVPDAEELLRLNIVRMVSDDTVAFSVQTGGDGMVIRERLRWENVVQVVGIAAFLSQAE